MKKVHFSFLIICAFIVELPALAGNVDVDAVYFYGDDSLTYCDIQLGLQRTSLFYGQLSADSVGAQFALISSIGQRDTIYLSDTIDVEDRSAKIQKFTSGAFFPYSFKYLLRPGQYHFEIKLMQSHATELIVDEVLNVPEMPMAKGISDLAFGAELQFNASPSQFTRNGIRFVPNPSAFYGSEVPMLYYYLECYGFVYGDVDSDSVTVTRNILYASSRKPARQPSSRRIALPGTSMAIADGFPAYTLQTDTYLLEIVVRAVGQIDRVVTKKFYVYRPEDFEQGRQLSIGKELATAIVSSGDDILNTIDPDSGLTLMQYVLTAQDMRRARDMDSDGKRKFMINFWSTSHPGEPGAANQYFARIAEANSRYSFLNREGWKTDRGRVFVQNGEPDYIDRRYADAAGSDHEIWYYDKLEGGVLFVFVDQSGFGDLDLVHSTKRGEIYNPDALSTQQNQNPVSRGLRE